MTTITADLALDITPLSGTIGAEIRGIDVHEPLGDDTVAAVRQALLDYKVIFFPGAHLDPDEHKHFAAYFGEITNAHPVVPGIGDHKEVFEIDYSKMREMLAADKEDGEYGGGEKWHTDVTFMRTPPLGSVLNAIVIPAAGGDTLWSDTQAAYEGLSQPFKDLVDGLTAVHDGSRRFGKLLDYVGQGEWDGEAVHRIGSGRASRGAHPPRDRSAQPVRQPGLYRQDQGADRQGERHPARIPLRPHGHSRVRGPLSVERGRPRVLGQPDHHALRHRRLREMPTGSSSG